MARIHFNASHVRGLGGDAVLRPGENDVPDHVWANWKDHDHIAPLVESGTITVLDVAEPEGEESAPADAPAKKGKKSKADAAAQ